MRFAGLTEKVTFDLKGNFHRDIRGAKIHFTGDGDEDNTEAADYMTGMAQRQTGGRGRYHGRTAPVRLHETYALLGVVFRGKRPRRCGAGRGSHQGDRPANPRLRERSDLA